MHDRKRLEEQIEHLRTKMYEIYENDPSDKRLLEVSQNLDELLNKFNSQDPTT
ncbi:aspartyl-phosphate phosphatase Spo0E family protein [Halobacillus fulvus]|nr:aspartyl-phosphate phosphatase Spo0E family protein [Halobacillus fulvus]